MNLDKLNDWLTLAANLGVLAGILLVAYEVRQNQELLELDYKLAILDSASLETSRYTVMREARIEDKEVAQLWIDGLAGRELDPADQVRFQDMCVDGLWADALMYDRSVVLERNVYAQGTVKSVQSEIRESPGMKVCWEVSKMGFLNWGYSDFVEAVDSR